MTTAFRNLGLQTVLAAFSLFVRVAPMFAEAPALPASDHASAVVDLATTAGTQQVKGVWRYSDTRIFETDFLAAGADGQPSATPAKTYDYSPHAGGADFDDSKWEMIAPESLSQRRGTGRLGFNWYRINITVPERVGDFSITGSTAVFETSLDDYAEISVNGELSRAIGQNGGPVIAGWNATNRLVIGRDLKPGQKIQLAIFGINGPISNPPTNYIWMRFARLEFHTADQHGPYAIAPSEVNVEVKKTDPALDEIVPRNPKIFKLAEGFQFTEGPIWVKDGGYLLFSDPNHNTIYKYVPESQHLSVYRDKSGYDGADIAEYGQPGSNGVTLDPQGRLTINQHGNRRVIRVEGWN